MEVYPCGTQIKTNSGKIDATIIGILIRVGRVTYDIAYFDDAKYHEYHVDEFMFTTDAKKVEIGFK